MRRPVRICEYPGCPEIVKVVHPYPLDNLYCPKHTGVCQIPDCGCSGLEHP